MMRILNPLENSRYMKYLLLVNKGQNTIGKLQKFREGNNKLFPEWNSEESVTWTAVKFQINHLTKRGILWGKRKHKEVILSINYSKLLEKLLDDKIEQYRCKFSKLNISLNTVNSIFEEPSIEDDIEALLKTKKRILIIPKLEQTLQKWFSDRFLWMYQSWVDKGDLKQMFTLNHWFEAILDRVKLLGQLIERDGGNWLSDQKLFEALYDFSEQFFTPESFRDPFLSRASDVLFSQ